MPKVKQLPMPMLQWSLPPQNSPRPKVALAPAKVLALGLPALPTLGLPALCVMLAMPTLGLPALGAGHARA